MYKVTICFWKDRCPVHKAVQMANISILFMLNPSCIKLRVLSKSPDHRPLWLLVGTLSAIRPQLVSRWAEHSLSYSDVTVYIFDILVSYLLQMLFWQRVTPLLSTWIYSCRSRVTVSCALPFATNLTISPSISQTFRSWVAIFHLRQPMVFLSHSSYGMPGLAPLMNVLF